MKLETKKQISFASNTGFDGVDAKISQDDMHKLWDILQDPYKNSIGAVVREYVSNSFDSHAEAKFIKENSLEEIRNEYAIYNSVTDEELSELKNAMSIFADDAVHVSIAKDDTGYYWATEDFGVGLSESRVVDVFANYLKSTKESSNNVIGAFGIGSKSGLSYTDIVYIRTRYNGFEYLYFLRKGENGPRLDFVNKEPTLERNGTQIKIYIKSVKRYSWESQATPEINRFEEECRNQLAYFDNVYFDNISTVNNNFTIIKGKNWIYNSAINNGSDNLSICLGKVAYPIDFNVLGIDRINFGLALKFEIGELDVIQTREDIKYTPRSKQAILDKIAALQEEFKEMWKAEGKEELEDFIEYLQLRGSNPIIGIGNSSYGLYDLIPKEELIAFSFKPFSEIHFRCPKASHFFEYSVNYRITPHRLVPSNLDSDFRMLFERDYTVYRIKGNTDSKKNKYISSLGNGKDIYLLRKKAKVTLKQYVAFLGLDSYPKQEWRTIISTYQKIVQKSLLKHTKSYDNTVIDKDWLDSQKVAKKQVDRTLLNGHEYQLYRGYDVGFSHKIVKLTKHQVLKDQKHQYIITTNDFKTELQNTMYLYYFHLCNIKKERFFHTLRFITVAPTNLKHFEGLNNVKIIKDFMKENERMFKTMATALYIKEHKDFKEISRLFRGYTKGALSQLSVQLEKDLRILDVIDETSTKLPQHNELFRKFSVVCIDYVKSNNLLDTDLIDSFLRIVNYFKDLGVLHYLTGDAIEKNLQSIAKIIYGLNTIAISKKQYKEVRHLNINLLINLK
jgi:hypothetical protein